MLTAATTAVGVGAAGEDEPQADNSKVNAHTVANAAAFLIGWHQILPKVRAIRDAMKRPT